MSHNLSTSKCFWPNGCSDRGRCNAFGSCIAKWQSKNKRYIFGESTKSDSLILRGIIRFQAHMIIGQWVEKGYLMAREGLVDELTNAIHFAVEDALETPTAERIASSRRFAAYRGKSKR